MISLKSERCYMNTLAVEDIDEAVPLLTNEAVRKYLGGSIPEAAARERLSGWIRNRKDLHFTVRLRENRAFMGIISVSPHHNPEDKELSYLFLPQFWGKGYAYEALWALIEYVRDTTGLSRIVSETQTANLRSCRLLAKLGFASAETVIRFGAEQSVYALSFQQNLL